MPGKKGSRGGDFLEGITTFVEKLSDLAEKGERIRDSGEFGSADKKVRGSYGVSMRVGLGDRGSKDDSPPIAPVREAERGTPIERASVQQVREPPVDVFDEGADVLVVAELPGIERGEIKLDLRGDILTVHAEHEGLKYHKEILLPRSFQRDQLQASLRNGVLEIRLAGERSQAS